MKPLFQGSPAGKITAAILASAIIVSSSVPAVASDPQQVQSPDTQAKALSPLPADTANDASAEAVPPTASAEAPSALKPALKYSPEPEQTTPSTPTAITTTESERATLRETSKSSDPNSADTVKKDLIAPADAEVTEPQPVATSGSDDAPKDLAQANRLHTATDPLYTRLPTVTGTVKTLRDFDKFPSNQIIHNLSFRDTPVKEVIAEISRRGNINIIIDKSSVGHITGDLHDLTLNEAMDTVLKSAGLQWRQLDSSTIIIGMPNALFRLGLNRPLMRVFKISYANAFDVAQLLWASAFNRGINTDFTTTIRDRNVEVTREQPLTKSFDDQARSASSPTAGGGSQISKTSNQSITTVTGNNENETGDDNSYSTKPDNPRQVRGALRDNQIEGTGFNAGATDPGSQTIRATTSVVTDYSVDQNNGMAICIPDSRNRQVIICGTQDDINIAEECIRLIDRRPRQVHIQSSLVELDNSGIRQLGASLNLQGAGASTTLLGGSGAPLTNYLPGLGSPGNAITQTLTNAAGTILGSVTNAVSGIAPVPISFQQQNAAGQTYTQTQGTGYVPSATYVPVSTTTLLPSANGFLGALGTSLPATPVAIGGVTASNAAQSAFNFLTLSKRAGGAANIATFPVGANISLNLVLQTNKAKLLANPSVLVDDNTEALITLANEVVHKVTTTVSLGVVSTNVELVQAGIFLNVIPKISEDGFITLRLRPQVSSPLGAPEEFANGSVVVTLLNIRQVMAQEVRIKDGQTLVIGGLFTEQEASSMAKVPYLAEAPILGALFRNTSKGRSRTELMLLITPKIVEEQPPNSLSDGGGPTL